jgi:hypothetical protein
VWDWFKIIFSKQYLGSKTVMTWLYVKNKLLTNSRHENQDRDHLRAKKPKREVRSGSCNVSVTPEA